MSSSRPKSYLFRSPRTLELGDAPLLFLNSRGAAPLGFLDVPAPLRGNMPLDHVHQAVGQRFPA